MEALSLEDLSLEDQGQAPSAKGAVGNLVDSEAVISMAHLEERFKAHPTIIPRIFKSFKDSFINFESQFIEASNAADEETMYRLAHSLKGSAANISAERLRDLSEDLEEKLKANQQIEAMEWFPWVVDHLSKVLLFIDEYIEGQEA